MPQHQLQFLWRADSKLYSILTQQGMRNNSLIFLVDNLPMHYTDAPSKYNQASDLPSSLPGYSAVAIALGQYHTCVIVSGGGVKCWGYNGYGQLGIGSSSTQYSPVDVSLGSGVGNRGTPSHIFCL